MQLAYCIILPNNITLQMLIYRKDIEEVNIEAEDEINKNMHAKGHII